jgi:hypothetical protein
MTGQTLGTAAGSVLGSVIPGLGTAIGGVAGGFLGSLFDSPDEAPGYQDYTDPRLSALSASLKRKKLGQQMAARQKAKNTRNANRQTESFENDPNASRSGMARSAAYNSAYGAAEEANVGANIAGAGLDQAAEERAGQLDIQNQQLSMQRNQYERQGWAANQVASPIDAAATGAFGLAAGNLLSGALNPGEAPANESQGGEIADQTVSGAAPSFMPPMPDISSPELPEMSSIGFPLSSPSMPENNPVLGNYDASYEYLKNPRQRYGAFPNQFNSPMNSGFAY